MSDPASILYGRTSKPTTPAPAAAAAATPPQPAAAPARAPETPQTQAQLADSLFGEGDEHEQDGEQHEPAEAPTREQIADSLYAESKQDGPQLEIPENIARLRAEWRDQDQERRLYPDALKNLGLPLENLFANVEADAPTKHAAAGELAELLRDIGASRTDTEELGRAIQSISTPTITAEQARTWQREADKALKERYGKDAKRAIEDARALVARDPRLLQMLSDSGLEYNPVFILKFAELGRRERARGRL